MNFITNCQWSGLFLKSNGFEKITRSVLIAAVYLNVALVLSVLSLVATVTVLAVHHRNDSTPVPQWLKVLSQLKPKTANKVENDHRNIDSSVTEDEFRKEKVSLDLDVTRLDANNTVNIDKLQTTILYGILLEMKEIKKTIVSATESGEWKRMAERLDVIFFRLFLVVTVIVNTIIVALYVRNV